MKKIGFVILNYCTWDETLRCAKSINNSIGDYELKICVVDNNSPIRPKEDLLSELRSITEVIIFNKDNKGYNYGNNTGLKYLLENKCDYYFVINSDVVINNNTVLEMVTVAETDNRIGVVGPKVFEKGRESFNGCNRKFSLMDFYLSTTFLAVFFKRRNEKLHSYIVDDSNNIAKVYSVSGCCLMLSHDCCSQIYPLDDTHMLYNEENMLGIRVEEKNYFSVIATEAQINHLHGASTSKNPAMAYIERLKSDAYYISNYLNKPKFAYLLLYLIRKIVFNIHSKKNTSFNPNNLNIPSFKELGE